MPPKKRRCQAPTSVEGEAAGFTQRFMLKAQGRVLASSVVGS
jgi:hypothetical protein